MVIHNENEFDVEEVRCQRKQQHHVDGVGSEEVVRATDDAGQREDDDGVRPEHVAQQALEDEVVEHPPGDDLHREDRKRHGTAHLGPSSGPVLKTSRAQLAHSYVCPFAKLDTGFSRDYISLDAFATWQTLSLGG